MIHAHGNMKDYTIFFLEKNRPGNEATVLPIPPAETLQPYLSPLLREERTWGGTSSSLSSSELRVGLK